MSIHDKSIRKGKRGEMLTEQALQDAYTERLKPASAAGPHMITVGDLTANMIGEAVLRIEHEGSTVQGTLMGLEIVTDTQRRYAHREGLRPYVADVVVAVTLGTISLDYLSRGHRVEVLR